MCSDLYPRYASFSASAPYAETESFDMYFDVSGQSYDPSMLGGYCSGGVYESSYKYGDETGGDSNGESHSYSLSRQLTKDELKACEDTMEELKVKLEAIPTCSVEIGYY
jgi:hypothetical protein